MQISISTNMKERNLGVPKLVRNLLKKYTASLILPGEQTPVLGPELVTTGSSDLTGWSTTSPGSYAVTGGRIAITDAGGTAGIYRDIAVTAGKEYLISAETEAVGGTGDMRAYVGGGFSTQLASTGLFTSRLTRPLKFIAQTSSIRLYIVEQGSTGTTCYAAGVSVREILSYNDTINGFSTGNYTDSVGTTPATIDGKTGLVVDAAGSVGPELIATSNVTGVQIDGVTPISYYQVGESPVVAGKFYKITLTVSAYAGSGDVGFITSNFTALSGVTRLSGNGTISAIVQAVATTGIQTFTRPATNTCNFSAISVRELTGTHALQATDGYKPVERRGLVNLLLATKDLSIGAIWASTGGSSVTATIAGPFSDTFAKTVNFPSGANIRQNSLTINGNGTVAVYVKRAASGSATAIRLTTNNGVAWNTGVSKKVVLTDAWQLALVSGVTGSGGTRTDVILGTQDASGGGDVDCIGSVDIYAPALFQGTVTAQQIIDAGGIPVTTDAPKSSSLGPRYWQFDGVDDRLQLSNSVINPQDDFAIIAAIKPTLVDSTARRVFSSSGTTSAVELYVGSNTGYPILRVKDDAAVDTFTSGVTSLLGVKSVVSARKTGNSKTIRVNGVQVTENTTATGSGTNTSAYIGTTSTGFGAFQGEKYLLILVKGAITDAELLLLEKFAGKLAGVQI